MPPARKRRPRVAELTAKRQAEICEALRQGNRRTVAARAAGVTPEDLKAWLKRGERHGAKMARWRDFRAAVLQAEAQAEAELVAAVKAASEKSWRAAMWLLEKNYASGPVLTEEEPSGDDEDEVEVDEDEDPIEAARDELAARRGA